MNITITGAAGRIGSTMTRHLTEAGHRVRAIDRSYAEDLGVRLEMVDLTDPLAAYRVLEDADALIHLATPSAYRITLDTFGPAVAMNMNLFQAAADLHVDKIVYSSSIQAMRGNRRLEEIGQKPCGLPYLPIDGNEPPNAGRLYGLTKAFGEQQLDYMCRKTGVSGVALRLPSVVDDHSMEWFRRITLDRLYPRHCIDEAFAWLHTDDAARLVQAILQTDLPGYRVYAPASDRMSIDATVPEVVERLYADVELRRPLEDLECLVDNSRITEETGWRPTIRMPRDDNA